LDKQTENDTEIARNRVSAEDALLIFGLMPNTSVIHYVGDKVACLPGNEFREPHAITLADDSENCSIIACSLQQCFSMTENVCRRNSLPATYAQYIGLTVSVNLVRGGRGGGHLPIIILFGEG